MVFPAVGEGTNVVDVDSASSTSRNMFSVVSWAKSGEHLSPIGNTLYRYLPNGVTMVVKSLDSSSNANV